MEHEFISVKKPAFKLKRLAELMPNKSNLRTTASSHALQMRLIRSRLSNKPALSDQVCEGCKGLRNNNSYFSLPSCECNRIVMPRRDSLSLLYPKNPHSILTVPLSIYPKDSIPLKINKVQMFSRKFLFSQSQKAKSCECINGHKNSAADLRPKRKESAVNFKYLIYKGNNSGLIKKLIELREGWSRGQSSLPSFANFIWAPVSQSIKFRRLKAMNGEQFVNHFEFHCELSYKSNLYNNLKSFCRFNKLLIENIVPMTFVLNFTDPAHTLEIEEFREYLNSSYQSSLPKTHCAGKNVWILKPDGFNRGKGIIIFDSLSKFNSILKEIQDSKPQSSIYVIQKYIERPLLIHNRKFDIRVWILICQNDNCYFFPQGYLRTSSTPYSLDNFSNKFIHLTNNAIQKKGVEYQKFELGNQLSFESFQNFLTQEHGNVKVTRIINRIKRQIVLSLGSVIGKLNRNLHRKCFEIFGYDFVVDENFQPWLIEVNTNPCLELSSPLLEQLIPRMLDDALSITIDSAFFVSRKPLDTPEVLALPTGNLWEFLLNVGSTGLSQA